LVVRKLEAEYLVPIEGVRDITVVLWPERIRAAKLEMGFEIRSPDLETVFCRGRRVNCKVDRENHKPVFWTDNFIRTVETACKVAKEARQF
jgi:acyl-CoA thioesterase FadM